METEAPVNADDQELQVVAQADAGAGGQLFEELMWIELCVAEDGVPQVYLCLGGLVGGTVGGLLVFDVDDPAAGAPDVAGIKEDGSVEIAEKLAAQL